MTLTSTCSLIFYSAVALRKATTRYNQCRQAKAVYPTSQREILQYSKVTLALMDYTSQQRLEQEYIHKATLGW